MVDADGRALSWSDRYFAGHPGLVAQAEAVCEAQTDPEAVAETLRALAGGEDERERRSLSRRGPYKVSTRTGTADYQIRTSIATARPQSHR